MAHFISSIMALVLSLAGFTSPFPEQKAHDVTIVWLHGGGWEGVAPDDFNWTAEFFEDRGYHVIRATYTLSPEAPHPAQINDVHTWIEAAAEDADRVVVMGASAGGHLASLAGTSWNDPVLNPGKQVRPDAVVSFAGPLDPHDWGNDIAFRFPQTVPSVARFIGPNAPESVEPLTYADPADPPQNLVYSKNDPIVPWSTQTEDAPALLAVTDGELHVVKGGHELADAPVWWIENWMRNTIGMWPLSDG